MEVWVKNDAVGTVPFKVNLKAGGDYDDLKKAIKNSKYKTSTFGHDEITIKNPDGSEVVVYGVVPHAASGPLPFLFTVPAVQPGIIIYYLLFEFFV